MSFQPNSLNHLTVNTVELTSKTPKNGAHTPVDEKDIAETSVELGRNSSGSTPCTAHANPFDEDIEAMMPTTKSQTTSSRKSKMCVNKGQPNCKVWPGQEHWKQKAKAAKMSHRSCQCMAHLSKRTRILIKVLIGLLIVGIAVGVGVGISKPLGAGIWKPKDQ